MIRRSVQATAILAIIGSIYGTTQYFRNPGDMLAWDQQAATLIEAQGFNYGYSIDNAAIVTLTNVTCVAATVNFTCKAPLNQIPITPGVKHKLFIVASNTTGTSLMSNEIDIGAVAVGK